MKFYCLTLFPEMVRNGMHTSITGRAMEKGLIELETVNIRDFTTNKHLKVDDYPYGGGAGLVMQAEPVYKAYESVCAKLTKKPRVVFLTPCGKTFHQKMAKELAQEEELIFLCGHYEGVDERVLEMIVTDNVSIGDYVLTGGELPAIPGLVNDAHGLSLDGNAPLPLQVHIIQHLGLHFTAGSGGAWK